MLYNIFITITILCFIFLLRINCHSIHNSAEVNDDYEYTNDFHDVPKYKFSYGVQDFKTGDYKNHLEERNGDEVKGEYSSAYPDGSIRTVRYTVTKEGGYVATVIVSYDKNYHGHINNQEEDVMVGAE